MISRLCNARMILDVTCVALLALTEHAKVAWMVTSFKVHHALPVVPTVINARAPLNALPAVMAITETLMVAVQSVQAHALSAAMQPRVPIVILVPFSMAVLASHAVLLIALVAMAKIDAVIVLTET